MKRREQKAKSGLSLQILFGSLRALLYTAVLLLCSALLISARVLEMERVKEIAMISCVLGMFTASMISVRKYGQKSLILGISIGSACFLLFLIAAAVFAERSSKEIALLPLLLISLGAGAFTGLLGRKKKRKHR